MFEMREPSHANRRFFFSTVAIAIASAPWNPTAGVQPANAPMKTAQKISHRDARSFFASCQSVLIFCQRRRNT